jgi:hypothetical protein
MSPSTTMKNTDPTMKATILSLLLSGHKASSRPDPDQSRTSPKIKGHGCNRCRDAKLSGVAATQKLE